MTTAKFAANQVSDLKNVAEWLIQQKETAPVMAFYGPMGAGKTTLIKAVCGLLKVTDEVNSPTFSIVNEYLTVEDESVFHFDFYRINKLEEAYDIGYENYFYGGQLCLIEWPEKIMQLLPAKYVKINITPDEDTGKRIITCQLIGV
ncbi:MAG: tRNA (adenosine(37)-N6)-threonylcarbamoyltransferase complex ATPase subunit type 1 TsaE [Bacteroidetes bacterium]|jgi:tRNA threonylcarbamoyladenosine biosynthesis protein TsaE|nr:tRNA (adenosine(37)-N6)-threonylcarbamoyltransferase complex ATPase subunit type 1 TsaE [Bacteroidota bacterium]MBU1578816.1 tRNA (adenosine(37)-N6)-threonylcarbamoyltransferase complex ATPase subunit type 1 TsaE [Bacteroidota bacterium]MBU2466120.1 tRNA (adenosine(37)-N6)-threonylcarbamoyltransferase complex ATPase subunit type 1 TsaE [Bacteroidota bacterium]MBU2557318.1 tRNA (adenosine(37)-N6)-threonylcarbamoyltransferase complex ATPase subunit type 1 TsaE [Bacteroidota bacterium]MDA394271